MREPVEHDACELLDADHLAVKHLFVEYARLAYGGDTPAADGRAAIALRICDELTVHAQIEEEIFYPALRDALPATADVVAEAEDEHAQAKALIAEIRGLGTPGDLMDQRVADLARVVEDHVKEERDELFPKARGNPGLDLRELGLALRARQQALEQEQGRNAAPA
ncbi:hemerythrin domain-containing protein [Aquabacterium sp. J223]|uniref:hemerythrin domain-containing protein n=1 Tax=Aquabacterium sp. J223 TaxID=2898431 RepID=UPI0021AD8622|nr:hemerythrin domain-containing protein [Aquabacterium sp. J223]UUX96710.1 hemerythrin domain-containing protein [Aquabacterium sp. J223]